MKTIRILTLSALSLAVAVAVVALTTTTAHAQSALKGTFHLQEEVQWGDAVLAAGDYSLTIESQGMPMQVTVRAADGKTAAILVSNLVDPAEVGGSALYITTRGNERKVRAINLPQLGIALHYERLNAEERRSLDLARNQSVSVQVARK